jgi:3-methyladenine DNA glycosylase AlkD
MNIKRMVREIDERLRAVGDPEAIAEADRKPRAETKRYNIYAAPYYALLKELYEEVKDVSPEDILKLAQALVDTKVHDAQSVGYRLIRKNKGAFAMLDAKTIERLAEGMDDWGSVDSFGRLISGPAWRMGLISDKRVATWAKSKSRWWRRCALVSTVALNERQTITGDPQRTLMICEMLLDDRDDMVEKAMSWALRELCVRDPKSVRAFLKKHGDRLAARARREVTNKLTTGLKNKRKPRR